MAVSAVLLLKESLTQKQLKIDEGDIIASPTWGVRLSDVPVAGHIPVASLLPPDARIIFLDASKRGHWHYVEAKWETPL